MRPVLFLIKADCRIEEFRSGSNRSAMSKVWFMRFVRLNIVAYTFGLIQRGYDTAT
ncbi:hypothetical protein UYSO10_1080 [Kosakonia radicincitans]|nr:hypothetical protein UYSO10_1080 [Kosakonia radicincitans]